MVSNEAGNALMELWMVFQAEGAITNMAIKLPKIGRLSHQRYICLFGDIVNQLTERLEVVAVSNPFL